MALVDRTSAAESVAIGLVCTADQQLLLADLSDLLANQNLVHSMAATLLDYAVRVVTMERCEAEVWNRRTIL